MVETKKKYFQVLEYYDSEVLNVVTVLELVGNCGTLVYVREHARSFGQDSGSSALIFWATRKCGCTHLSVGTWRAAQINGSWGRTSRRRLRGSPGQRTVLRVSGPLDCWLLAQKAATLPLRDGDRLQTLLPLQHSDCTRSEPSILPVNGPIRSPADGSL